MLRRLRISFLFTRETLETSSLLESIDFSSSFVKAKSESKRGAGVKKDALTGAQIKGWGKEGCVNLGTDQEVG